MDGQSAAGGPAPAAGAEGGAADGCIAQGSSVRERFTAEVRGAAGLNEDERERVLDMGLRALGGEPGLGVV